MKALVTGCAGFIGSALTDRLLNDGNEVVGIDRFSDYYARDLKVQNLSSAMMHPRFSILEEDIVDMEAFPSVEYVFHLAAQAGVRASWGKSFEVYARDNILATQRLLEYYKDQKIRKFVFSSSSSVYGDVALPMKEDLKVQPVSPYGVSKLAAEHLCYLYWKNYRVPTVSLRYFTVYGPRQRPDMGINKFVHAILNEAPITIYGDGRQTRDFTYIDDVVEANIISAQSHVCGEVFNIGGGNRISVIDLIAAIEAATGKRAMLNYVDEQKGDVKDTWADARKAEQMLRWRSRVRVQAGLEHYIRWIHDA